MAMLASSIVLAGSCALALALLPGPAVSSATASSTLPRTPAPAPPSMPPMTSENLSVDQGRVPGAYATISPRVVHPGGRVTLRFGGGPDVRWHLVSAPGALSEGCSSSMQGTGSKTCTATIAAADLLGPLPMWLPFQVGFDWLPSCSSGGCISSSERTNVALLPASSSLLSGSVRDAGDHMVRGVPITISGQGRRYATTTNGAGEFTAILPTGTWTVAPAGTWDPPARVIRLGAAGARADFKAPVSELDFSVAGSRLVNGVDWTTAPASGLALRSGVVRAHTSSGRPLADRTVQIDAPYVDGSSPGQSPRPRISVCDAVTWRPLFTTGDRTERVTDSNGEVGFTLMLGTEIGTSLLHARLADDVTALDVERIGQTGAVTGPSVPDIVTPMQNATRLGLPAPPMFAIGAGSLQAVLVEWWLGYRAGEQVGPDRMLPAGDFVPVRSRDNQRAAIVFYPAGNPRPLRDHLTLGSTLPTDYPTATLGFRQVPFSPDGKLLQWQAVLTDLPALSTWEAANGPATDGFVLNGTGLGTAGWLGGPVPPVIVDRTARSAYARCVPGASPPTTIVEVHSPVTVDLAEGGGGFAIRSPRSGPVSYVVPGEATELALNGTGSGRAVIVVRAGDVVRSYDFRSRRGAGGVLTLNASGAPSRLTFAGRVVPAAPGVALRLSGLPRTLAGGRATTVTARVTDAFGSGVENASVTVRGAGIRAGGSTDGRGVVRLTLRPTSRGRITLVASAPGARPARVVATAR